MTKKILIAAFVKKDKREWFLQYILKKFNVNEDVTFSFEIENDELHYLITFYIEIDIENKINIKKLFDNALIVHKKNKTFYTINALNKLIERDFDLEVGNINYKNCIIDWKKFKNKIILISKGDLVLLNLNRVFN